MTTSFILVLSRLTLGSSFSYSIPDSYCACHITTCDVVATW